MSQSTGRVSFRYQTASNIGVDEDAGAFAINIADQNKTLISPEISFCIFNLIRIIVDNVQPIKIKSICISDSGVFNNFESEILETTFDVEPLRLQKTPDRSLLLLDLSNPLYSRGSGQWENIYENTLHKFCMNLNSSSYALLVQSKYQMDKYGFGSTKEIIQRNGLYQKFSIFVEPRKYESLFVESVESLADKPDLYYGFYILFLSHEKTDETFIARAVGSDEFSRIVEAIWKNSHQISANEIPSEEGFFVRADEFLSWDKWDKNIRYKNIRERNSWHQNILLQELYSAPPEFIDEKSIFELKNKNSLFVSVGIFPNQDFSYFQFFQKEIRLDQITGTRFKEVKIINYKFDLNLINIEYLEWFFSTEFGQYCYDFSLPFSSDISFLDRISKTCIPLPSLQMQLSIISEIKKIQLVKKKLDAFRDLKLESVFYSNYFSETAKKINQILEVFESLSDSEKLIQLIMNGESKTLEFKQTLSLDVKTGAKAKYIEDSVIKTIGAFLNSDGGMLLIGVEDSGMINGINEEVGGLFKSKDKYLLHLKNLIMSRLGADLYPLIDQRVALLNDKEIVVIKCSPSSTEVYVDGKDFYVRTNPSTDKLEGPKLVGYIKNRFKN